MGSVVSITMGDMEWEGQVESTREERSKRQPHQKEGDIGVRQWVAIRQFPGSQEGQEVLVCRGSGTVEGKEP